MPSPVNNQTDQMLDEDIRRRRLFALAIFIATALVALGLYFIFRPETTPGQYVDPLSHEVVSSPPGKSPDKYGLPGKEPAYLGFGRLLNDGLTITQINNLKAAYYLYTKKQQPAYSIVSVDVDHISISRKDQFFFMSFKTSFDNKVFYSAKVAYSGLSDIRLFLYNEAGKKLFDSKKVTSPSQFQE